MATVEVQPGTIGVIVKSAWVHQHFAGDSLVWRLQNLNVFVG